MFFNYFIPAQALLILFYSFIISYNIYQEPRHAQLAKSVTYRPIHFSLDYPR